MHSAGLGAPYHWKAQGKTLHLRPQFPHLYKEGVGLLLSLGYTLALAELLQRTPARALFSKIYSIGQGEAQT